MVPSQADIWHLVMLTARNAEQKELFELQLARLQLVERKFCERIIVLEDVPKNAKIGSGGATLNAFRFIYNNFGGQSFFSSHRILILHSGGLSQRIFHVALTGKAFMQMPDGRTLLEHKLLSYLPFLHSICHQLSCGFVFIASADVLEHFPTNFTRTFALRPNTELLLIAHQSTMEVAEQHGVYLLGDEGEEVASHEEQIGAKSVKRVLQKPGREAIRRVGAILTDKNGEELILTDSCYMIGHSLAVELVRLSEKMSDEPLAEICCYRDFLGPLGFGSEEERKVHFRADDPNLRKWQIALWDLTHSKKTQLLDLGPQSFFHFGTPNELLAHFFDNQSAFRNKFLRENEVENVLFSIVDQKDQISKKSFVEWCKLNTNCEVGEYCILSGLIYEGEQQLRIPDGTCASTFPVNHSSNNDVAECQYVTVAFHRDDDLKRAAVSNALSWFGHKLAHLPSDKVRSLWEMPLFSSHSTPAESLCATLATIDHLPILKTAQSDGTPLMSISQVLNKANAKKLLNGRKQFSN